jgi:hypothetical protein
MSITQANTATSNIAGLAELLRETTEHHGAFMTEAKNVRPNA